MTKSWGQFEVAVPPKFWGTRPSPPVIYDRGSSPLFEGRSRIPNFRDQLQKYNRLFELYYWLEL